MKAWLQLIKIRLTLLVTFSAAAGFLLVSKAAGPIFFLCLAGVFLLSSGAAVLNQIQERDRDSLMERTKMRPIPSGQISRRGAWLLCLILVTSGLISLSLIRSETAFFGLLALLIYNGIYTPLKRKSILAVLPGGVVGVLPPLIGWTAAGAGITSSGAIVLMLFFYLWQIAHFWLFIMIHEEDYRRGGFPTLSERLHPAQEQRITFIWISATLCSGLLFPLYGLVSQPLVLAMLIFSCVIVFLLSVLVFSSPAEYSSRLRIMFHSVNLYVLVTMVLLILDHQLTG